MEPKNLIHTSILNRFSTMMQNDRMAHAYLFIGSEGVGKFETARAIAKMVNCEKAQPKISQPACDQCPSCLKSNSGNHPDLYVVHTEFGESIKIDEVRKITSQLQLRPYEAKKKVVIIRNVENLTTEGANALLKTLEEPTAQSLLILTTSVLEKNLDTVKSRCHRYHFPSRSPQDLADSLAHDYKIKHPLAHFLAYYTEGSLGKAVHLNDHKIQKQKDDVIDYFMMSKGQESFLKKVLVDKKQTDETLNILLSFVRDLILIKAGVNDERLMHVDRLTDLQRTHQRFSFDELQDITAEIVKTKRALNDNLNVKIGLNLLKESVL